MKDLIRLWEAQQPAATQPAADEVEVLRDEAHKLLRSFLMGIEQSNALEEQAFDAAEADGKMWVAHILLQDVILRLCKFDDDDSRSWSFEQAAKKLRKHKATEKRAEGYEELLKAYRKEIGHLTEQHRNNYIAHLTKTPSGKDKKPKPMTEAITQALAFIDNLAGKRTEYVELDGKRDLRAEFEKLVAG
jgi:hypothetical protein